MKKTLGFKLLLGFIIVLIIGLFFIFDLHGFVSLDQLKQRVDSLKSFYGEHKLWAMAMYMAAYIIMAALSLPGAVIMTLAGGAIFGLVYGTVLVSFASTTGATFAFLFSRYLFKDWVQLKFSAKFAAIDKRIEKEGGLYLFTLRLVPIFPFFVINLTMGLTSISIPLYYGVSQLGMLPATIVYVNAGTQLAKIESVKGILSAELLLSFALLGMLPFIAKWITTGLRQRKIYKDYPRPKSYDYNLAVVGAGSAGLVAAYIAAAVKAKVALIEADKMGGDCLNTGCVPSKSLIASARLLSHVKRAKEFGLKKGEITYDFSRVMERIQTIIKKVEPQDSIDRYAGLGVDCFTGRATILSPFEVKVHDQIFTTQNIIVATGATPLIPDLPGIETIKYLTSDNVWSLRELPKSLVVLGAGPIGCELAQAFSRMGSKVTLVQRGMQVMKKEDPDAAQIIQQQFVKEGIHVLLDHAVLSIEKKSKENELVCGHDGKEVRVPFDRILIAIGRKANTKGFGLEELGVKLKANQTIDANEYLQTNFPNIYCSGDVHGRFQFTHTAAHESFYAAVNALFGKVKRFVVDYSILPWATFTEPEVARVGINETEAGSKGIQYEMVKYEIADLDRAIADSEDYGFVKVLTVPGKDKILGVTIVGNHAADIIAEFVLAMKHGIGLNKIFGTIHIYPTMAEANKYAAGLWKKTHAPEKMLSWMKKYHAWQRK